MNRAWPRSGQTNSQLSGELRVSARHEGRRLLVTHLYEADLILARAQGFHDAVNAIARKPKDELHAPIDKAFNEHIGSSHIDFSLLIQMLLGNRNVATGGPALD